LGLAGCDLGVGIGIHAGELSFGEFGWSHCDLTAIGTVITPPPWQVRAGTDQILVTREVNQCAQPEFSGSEGKVYQLKGVSRTDRALRGLIALPIVEIAPRGEPFHCHYRLNGKYGKNGKNGP
jgi:class 3 adenylate cyclase